MSRNELCVKATRKTPRVMLSDEKCLIQGRSIPENPGLFYRPLYEWFLSNLSKSSSVPVIELGFEYLNTASAKWIFLILRDLTYHKYKYRLVWYYEVGDSDMLELGLMYKSILGCPFVSVEVDEIVGAGKEYY